MEKEIKIDGKPVKFKASAAIPRIYRLKFGRDIYNDIRLLETRIKENDKKSSTLDNFSLEMFENVAFIMAKHADKDIPDEVEEWLDEFEVFSIYEVMPEIIELWKLNAETHVQAKKNSDKLSGK